MWRIKKIILALLIIPLLVISSFDNKPALAQSGTAVRVDPAVFSAQINDTFDTFVRIDNATGLTAFEIHLSFSPEILEVVSVSNGGFLTADFTVQNTFDNIAGTIDYAVAQLGGTPGSGSGALLKITFRAKANGASQVSLRSVAAAPSGLLLADSNGASISVSWTGGSVTVGTGQGATTVAPTESSAPVTATTVPGLSATPTATSDITPTPTPTSTAVPSDGLLLGTHTVRWSETLYCIGRGYRVNPWSIAEKNRIRWPYWIFPGQKLIIPNAPWGTVPAGRVCQVQFDITAPTPVTPTATVSGPSPTVSAATATPTPTQIASSCRTYHIVRSGETLYRIGISYGVSYQEIARVNQIANPRLIYVGQRLCIP